MIIQRKRGLNEEEEAVTWNQSAFTAILGNVKILSCNVGTVWCTSAPVFMSAREFAAQFVCSQECNIIRFGEGVSRKVNIYGWWRGVHLHQQGYTTLPMLKEIPRSSFAHQYLYSFDQTSA